MTTTVQTQANKAQGNSPELMQQLQAVEERLHMFTAQRNSYQAQLFEMENASKELSEAKEGYRIIGTIMVKTNPEQLKKEIDEKKGTVQSRITGIEKQEQLLRTQMQEFQKKLLGS